MSKLSYSEKKHLFSGKVGFIISGRNISRFISKCTAKGIILETISYISGESVPTIHISVCGNSAKSICKIALECKLKVRSKERHGIRFFMHKYRNRSALLFGSIIAIAILFILSNFIMVIEVSGRSRISEARMNELLKEIELKEFMYIDRMQLNKKAKELERLETDIAEATISANGVKVTVMILETQTETEKDDSDDFRNLYASCDGIIVRIYAYTGKAVVKKGDAVKKGDMLISGDISTSDKVIQVHARGKVVANVGYSFSASFGPSLPAFVKSGRFETRTEISILGKSFLCSSYNEYETEQTDKAAVLRQLLPIKYREIKVFELVKGERTATHSELKQLAYDSAYQLMSDEIDKNARIIQKTTVYEISDTGVVTAIINVVTEEDITMHE